MRPQAKEQLRPAVGSGRGVLHREATAELAFAGGDREGDFSIRQEIAVLIAHFHDQGLSQLDPRGTLLAVARDDRQRVRTRQRFQEAQEKTGIGHQHSIASTAPLKEISIVGRMYKYIVKLLDERHRSIIINHVLV